MLHADIKKVREQVESGRRQGTEMQGLGYGASGTRSRSRCQEGGEATSRRFVALKVSSCLPSFVLAGPSKDVEWPSWEVLQATLPSICPRTCMQVARKEVVQKETFMAANEEFRVLRPGKRCLVWIHELLAALQASCACGRSRATGQWGRSVVCVLQCLHE